MTESLCGYISIIGKPNVGKSTILNHVLGKKISITSRKSQTTRNNILGIKNIENAQLIFADTPGMHIKSPKIMNKVLNKSAEGLIDYSDIALFVTQRLKLDDQDMSVLKKLKAEVVGTTTGSEKLDSNQKSQQQGQQAVSCSVAAAAASLTVSKSEPALKKVKTCETAVVVELPAVLL